MDNNEGTLCYAVHYVVTGYVQFTAMSRHWAFSQSLVDPHYSNYCNQVSGYQIPADWMANGTVGNGVYYLPGPPDSNWSSALHNFPLWDGNGFTNSTTLTSTETVSTGLDFQFSVTGDLPGAPTVSVSVSESWGQSISVSTTLSVGVHGPGTGAVSWYNVEGEGAGGTSNAAETVSVFYWQGHDVGGSPWCGTPP